MPRPKTVAATYRRVTLRIPEDVFEVLQTQAETIGRPFNTHALRVLRYGLGLTTTPPLLGERYDEHHARHS